MRIGRFGAPDGAWFWGLIDPDTDTVRRILGDLSDWAAIAAAEDRHRLPVSTQAEPLARFRLLAPLDPQGRVFGVGANYRAHLERLGVSEPPPHPTAFMKPNSAIIGPGDEIRYPPITAQLDYEVELVIVMGGDESTPLLGFTIGNDVSARDAQGLGGLDLFSMKSLDRSTPVGPWIVTPAELNGSSQPKVDIMLRVNGEQRQRDNTAVMVWAIPEIISYVDERVELRCGDIIFTGTTAGVGLEDGRFLQPGDLIEAEIAGIGVLRNVVGHRQP
ncbi:2-hydroxyhepta-2,4-diene-1,7-dioate isomerase [Mycobacterium heckeshornense]|uniref:fumarylacetoacetate hydrolase family protein n=1 Tax=Mycobacterium heckeshornense TaxID=110505 RepID=UPI001940D84D|nr:fumarylacetoacetate hydrolase family protein [Mycobacterium heckeshornense]BCQ07366.1 2-hydroxyhepta-2,4-diene-1,7-dioate isomerase [Mycobacterium heckeshornense]